MSNKKIIVLNEDYRIRSDERNYILEKKCEPKTDEELKGDGFKTVGYYCRLEHLFDRLIEDSIRFADSEKLQGIVDSINELKADLKPFCEKKGDSKK